MANPDVRNTITADGNGNPLLSDQQSNVTDATGVVAVTYTANDPTNTPNNAITFATGTALAVDEVYEFVDEVEAALSNHNIKINAILDVLEAHGLMADS